MNRVVTFVAGLVGLLCGSVWADVKLPNIFGSHMVLQREKPIAIWGVADPGEQVSVQIGETRQVTRADDAGRWRVSLPAMNAGGPHTVSITGKNTLTLEDVLIGEVWLCAGQSNMEMGIGPSLNGQKEIASADHPQIRLMWVHEKMSHEPVEDVTGAWQVCTPVNAGRGVWGGFSGTAYYFGKMIQQELNVPVGLIQATRGGTKIEPWTPRDANATLPELADFHQQMKLADSHSPVHQEKARQFLSDVEAWITSARQAVDAKKIIPDMPAFPESLQFDPREHWQPMVLFNGMIHPLTPMSIRGVIWYQGESNSHEGVIYARKLQAMIGGWRKAFDQGDFPFYFAQIAPYEYGNHATPTLLPDLWMELQKLTTTVPNTAMAGTTDISNIHDIHPTNKQEVGKRLALLALAKTYGKQVEYSGPTFKAITKEGTRLRISFDHLGGGLVSRDGKPLNWFEILDAKGDDFVPADAVIDVDTVVISAAGVSQPIAARFCYHKMAEPNLAGKSGLPALTFKTADPPRHEPLTLEQDMRDFQLLYELDLSKLGPSFSYDLDNRDKIKGTPTRVAYRLETQSGKGPAYFVWVSMDAFTTDLKKLGIPTAASGARFQQPVTNMNVLSDWPRYMTPGEKLAGSIEFWPNDYGPENTAKVPGAANSNFDWGDTIHADVVDGYGCMQVHNLAARQVIFAINHWKAGENADIGMGSRPGQDSDWTLAENAGSYDRKRLQVFVRVK